MNWPATFLKFAGALFVLALPAFFANSPALPIVLLAMAALSTVAAGVTLGVKNAGGRQAVRTRFLSRWQRLKHVRLRSPLFSKVTVALPDITQKKGGVDLANFAVTAEMQLRQHQNVIRYGNIQLQRSTRLADSDLMFLQKAMRDLSSAVWEAGDSILKLFVELLEYMSAGGEQDPRFWISEELKGSHLDRIKRVLTRFEEEVEAGADSREALAAFHFHYRKTMAWNNRMASFLEKPLESLDTYKTWKVRHDQYAEVFREKLELPQFEVLKHWMHTSKIEEDWSNN